MINYKEEELKRAKGLDYWKLKLFGSYSPDYVCRSLGDFIPDLGQLPEQVPVRI